MSAVLQRHGREHVVLERRRVGEGWRTERWDSLRFQFPNWSLQLPGWRYLRLRYCVFSEASTSMTSWIFSPTTTPPVGSAMLAVMPQSVRLISPMADRPTRVPP
jgi:hypothetical protein